MDRDIIRSSSNHRHVLQNYGVKSIRFFEFIRLKNELSELWGCNVDLATPGALHNAMKDEILEKAIRAA